MPIRILQPALARCAGTTITSHSRRRNNVAPWFVSMMILLLFFFVNAQAQDPVYKLVSHRTSAAAAVRSQPWRSYPPSQSGRRNNSGQRASQQQQRRLSYQPDYTEKFLDFDVVMADPRARIFSFDDFRRRRPNNFSVTSRLVFFTLAAFCLQVWKPSVTTMGMKLSERILRGEQLYRTVTPIFLHGGIFHLFTNMMSLQRVGNDVEKLFGPGRYLATYLVAGVAGNLMSAVQSPNPSLGASGAVFGIVGAYFVFLNRNEWLLGNAGQAITSSIGQTILTNLMLGLVMPQIDQWAHLGGAVGGGLMAYAFGPRLYLSDVPVGGGGDSGGATGIATRRVVIDRPVLRAPAYLESIPGAVGHQWQRLSRTLDRQVTHRLFGSGNNKPWQSNPGVNRNYHMRRQAPNRSIKPGKVD